MKLKQLGAGSSS